MLIAVCDATGPLYGIIDQPYIGERFRGGFGTRRDDRPAWAPRRWPPSTPDAGWPMRSCFTTFPEVGTPVEGAAFSRVAPQCRLTRYGMDCYAYALLAAGHVDLVIEAGLQAYDVCAPIAVIEAAGGLVTDWQGGPVAPGRPGPRRRQSPICTPPRWRCCADRLRDGSASCAAPRRS